ncbi:hypothetical protein GOODEAATRI_008757, partial [Goodea atripinnis]
PFEPLRLLMNTSGPYHKQLVIKVWAADQYIIFLSLPIPPYRFQRDDYAVEVKLNDYLDIVCPHYPQGEVPLVDAEQYVLYMVEREDYESCKPQSYDQKRWECSHPFAPHAPEKFSEKFQRFTPFTFGKEFRQGQSYYYICKCCHGSFIFLFLSRNMFHEFDIRHEVKKILLLLFLSLNL